MKYCIDEIFDMLSWDNSEEIQAEGISEAKKIKHMSVLICPIENKSIWENCAKVLATKEERELDMYLIGLFGWLQDMNWPGAYIIYDKLCSMNSNTLKQAHDYCLQRAIQTHDLPWINVLKSFNLER